MADTRVIPIEEHSMMTHSEISTETHITGVKVVSIKSKSSSEFTKNGILYILIFPLSYIREKFQPGDLKGSVLTIFATATGVGVLSLPYAVNLSGLYQGIVLFIFGMIASLYSCQLLVLTAEKTGQLTYQLIGNELYGPRMKTFTEINMIINTYGGVIAYIILIKDLVPNCLKLFEVTNSIATNSYIWGSLICTLIIYPLSLKEKISALRYT
jgi:sodium-coupled neutral amino acid transporter 11